MSKGIESSYALNSIALPKTFRPRYDDLSSARSVKLRIVQYVQHISGQMHPLSPDLGVALRVCLTESRKSFCPGKEVAAAPHRLNPSFGA